MKYFKIVFLILLIGSLKTYTSDASFFLRLAKKFEKTLDFASEFFKLNILIMKESLQESANNKNRNMYPARNSQSSLSYKFPGSPYRLGTGENKVISQTNTKCNKGKKVLDIRNKQALELQLLKQELNKALYEAQVSGKPTKGQEILDRIAR